MVVDVIAAGAAQTQRGGSRRILVRLDKSPGVRAQVLE
jgi:hypothetical protein